MYSALPKNILQAESLERFKWCLREYKRAENEGMGTGQYYVQKILSLSLFLSLS